MTFAPGRAPVRGIVGFSAEKNHIGGTMNCPNCGMKLGNADTRCRVCGAAVPYARSGGFEPDADTRYNPYGPGDSSPSAQIKGTALRGAGVYSSSSGAAASEELSVSVFSGLASVVSVPQKIYSPPRASV